MARPRRRWLTLLALVALSASASATPIARAFQYQGSGTGVPLPVFPTAGGISAAASDLTPLVFYNNGWGQAVTSTIQGGTGSSIDVTYGANAPFGTDGAAVFYKGNNAIYLKAGVNGTVGQIANFVSADDTDNTQYKVAP